MKKLILLIMVCLAFVGCDFSSATEVNDSEINDILDDIVIAFSMYDINSIMAKYWDSFLHNGNDYDDEYQIWDSRLINYNEIKIEDREINYVGTEYAEVLFTLKFINDDTTVTYEEPSLENGDLTYFQKENDQWKLIGNQLD